MSSISDLPMEDGLGMADIALNLLCIFLLLTTSATLKPLEMNQTGGTDGPSATPISMRLTLHSSGAVEADGKPVTTRKLDDLAAKLSPGDQIQVDGDMAFLEAMSIVARLQDRGLVPVAELPQGREVLK